MSQQLKQRMENILKALNENIHEREEVFSVALLSALADQNIFLYGPPGTAKSLISRRLAKVFKNENYFEYLMQKFSTPEEVFGPISLTELKKDNYVRKTDGYLPNAEFAFLDEIWKSSPAILNTLLTALNEKKFRNGKELVSLPLKVVVSASNETPSKGQGLEALYDRFLTRLYVPTLENKNNFEALLQAGGSADSINIDNNLLIKNDEWEQWKKEFKNLKISIETFNIINAIKLEFAKDENKDLDIYISDRRWTKAAELLKASAYFCEREEINIIDCLLLSHCLWSTKDNKGKVIEIVENTVRDNGFDTGYSLDSLDEEKDELEKEIKKELLYSDNVYKTVKLKGNKQYFKVTKNVFTIYNEENITFYIEYNKIKTTKEFHSVDENGNELEWLKCNFQNQGSCSIKYNKEGRVNSYYLDDKRYWENLPEFKPTVLFHKGDQKEEVNERLIESLQSAISTLSDKLKQIIKDTEFKKDKFLQELDTPFVTNSKIKIAIESVNKQIEDLKLRHKDCERLESLVG
jgi:MoxR-like ATPase